MLEQALTETRIITAPALSAGDMDRVVAYAAGAGARVCAVVDGFPMAARDAIVAGLSASRETRVLNRVVPNPRVEDIMAMAGEVRAFRPDAIVAIGGGSTLDSAKALSVLSAHEGDLEEYLGPDPARKIAGRGALMIAVPTTAGTGAEVTRFGVYTARGGRKYTLAHPALQPDVAILAAALTHSLPPDVTAATGIDALSHALETIWNRNGTPASDAAAIGAAAAILEWLPVAHGSAREGGAAGRGEMLEAACRAGTAFNRTGTAMVHALSFILSEEWHVPHGAACAFTLEDAVRINGEDAAIAEKLARIGAGGPGALAGRIVSLKRSMGLPFTFGDVGAHIGPGDIARLFGKAFDDPKMKNNAVPVSEERVFGLLREKL